MMSTSFSSLLCLRGSLTKKLQCALKHASFKQCITHIRPIANCPYLCRNSVLLQKQFPNVSQHILLYASCKQCMFLQCRTFIRSPAQTGNCLPSRKENRDLPTPSKYLNALVPHILETFGPDKLTDCVSYLHQCLHKDLCESLPWLQYDENWACTQLRVSKKLDEATLELRQHPTFVFLKDLVERSHKDYDDDQLTSTLLKLIFLGVSPEDPTIHRLLFDVHNRVPQMALQPLKIVTLIQSALGILDTIATRASMKRITYLFKQYQHLSPDEISDITQITVSHASVMSQELLTSVFKLVQRHVQDPAYLTGLEYVANILAFVVSVGPPVDHVKMLPRDNIKIVINQCLQSSLKQMDGINDHFIRAIYPSLRNMNRVFHAFDSDIHRVLEHHALSLLDDTSGIREISNILFAVCPATPRKIMHEFDAKLFHNLNDVDVVTLYGIGKNIQANKFYKKVTLTKFLKLAAGKTELMTKHEDGIIILLQMLQRTRTTAIQDNQSIIRALMKALTNAITRREMSMAVELSSFLLSLPGCPGLPTAFYNVAVRGAPYCFGRNVIASYSCIKDAKHALLPKAKHQIMTLQESLTSHLPDQIRGLRNVGILCELTDLMRAISKNSDSGIDHVVIEALMHKYMDITSDRMEPDNVRKVIKSLTYLNYICPVILDNLTMHVLEMGWSKFRSKMMCQMTTLLARSSYRPKDFDIFITLVLDIMRTEQDLGHHGMVVSILRSMAYLEYFPEAELRSVFTLELLQSMDKVSRNDKWHAYYLMELNRFCVLDCPQLNVPWFHEQYCQDTIVKHASGITWDNQIRKEVKQALTMMYNKTSFKHRTHSLYYYLLDFECILNDQRQLVNMDTVPAVGIPESWQRVAILVHRQKSYFVNVPLLLPYDQTRIRHLEILGYKVVQIPHFEWASMALAKFEDKCQYLHNKIFH